MEKLIIQSENTLPPYRLVNSVVVLARIAARYGVHRETLLEGSDIDPADLDDPQRIIRIEQERIVADRLIQLTDVPWVGLEVGREYHFSANGKLGMAVMCCETVLEALKLIMAYIHLTGAYHQYIISIKGETGYARFRELTDLKDVRRFTCEAEIASVNSMIRIGYNNAAVFREIHFAYPQPVYADKYDEIFNCSVFFNAPENLIVFDAGHLYRPMLMANPLVRSAMEKECARLSARLREQDTLSARIYQELWACREDGFPTLDEMARRIYMSTRTIRRRLTGENTSYKAIQTEIRKSMASNLLLTTDLPMETIATRLGFSEPSSFYRAFKTWTGCTPNTYRASR